MDVQPQNLAIITNKSNALQSWATGLAVTNEAESKDAVLKLKAIKETITALEEQEEHFYRPAKQSADNIKQMFKAMIEPTKEAYRIASKRVADFVDLQAAEAQKKLDAEAVARQEAALNERVEVEAEATERIEDIKSKTAEAEQSLRDAGLGSLADAVAAEGNQAAADLLANTGKVTEKILAQAAKPIEASKTVSVGGASFGVRKVWRYEVTDKTKLPNQYTQPDLGEIQRAVAAGTRDIPGVRIFQDNSSSIR